MRGARVKAIRRSLRRLVVFRGVETFVAASKDEVRKAKRAYTAARQGRPFATNRETRTV